MLMKPVVDPLFQTLIARMPPLSITDGPWIAGGAARKLWENNPWTTGDLDVFFTSGEQLATWKKIFETSLMVNVQEEFEKETECMEQEDNTFTVELFNNFKCLQTKPKNKFYVAHQSDNAITYRMPGDSPLTGITVQMIKRRFGESVEKVWDSFDFHNCEFATDGKTLLASESAAWGSLSGELLLKDSDNTRNLPLRTLKYHLHGFEASKELLLTAVEQLTKGGVTWDNDY
jgi:hypothetical protein